MTPSYGQAYGFDATVPVIMWCSLHGCRREWCVGSDARSSAATRWSMVPRAPKIPPDIVRLQWARAPRSASSGAQPSVRTRHSWPRSLSVRTVESTVSSLANPPSTIARMPAARSVWSRSEPKQPSQPGAVDDDVAGRRRRRPASQPASPRTGRKPAAAGCRTARAVAHPDHPSRRRRARTPASSTSVGRHAGGRRRRRRRTAAGRRTSRGPACATSSSPSYGHGYGTVAADERRHRGRRQPCGMSPTTPSTKAVLRPSISS